MHRKIIFLFCLFFAESSFTQIFNGDDRLSFFELNKAQKQIAKSVVALIPKKHLSIAENGKVTSTISTLGDKYSLCHDEKFHDEDIVANCSGALIDKNRVLTAAHCLSLDVKDDTTCRDYYIVFDYFHRADEIKVDQIYGCKKVLHHDSERGYAIDLAVIELDRKVHDRQPLKVAEVDIAESEVSFMMGFPLGISLKQTYGEVLKSEIGKPFFKHNLDTFSVNSGSPTFNDWGEIVGVLVRSTGWNRQRDDQNKCYRWAVAKESDFAESTKISELPTKFRK
jgi:V8-like Glu-specific endopeptidase